MCSRDKRKKKKNKKERVLEVSAKVRQYYTDLLCNICRFRFCILYLFPLFRSTFKKNSFFFIMAAHMCVLYIYICITGRRTKECYNGRLPETCQMRSLDPP